MRVMGVVLLALLLVFGLVGIGDAAAAPACVGIGDPLGGCTLKHTGAATYRSIVSTAIGTGYAIVLCAGACFYAVEYAGGPIPTARTTHLPACPGSSCTVWLRFGGIGAGILARA